MRVLQLHNAYQAGLGGEDTVLRNEHDLLLSNGHEVFQRTVTTTPDRVSGAELIRTARNSVYSLPSRTLVRDWVKETQPDVVHVHNTFPLLSPSVFHEFCELGVPTVLTLHNYRLACANALFLRDGKVCDGCIKGSPWQAVRHRCYRGSLAGSGIQAVTRIVHDKLSTFKDKVDAMIVLSDFAKGVFKEIGIPEERLHVKPNFVHPSSLPRLEKERAFVFVGKLVPEKGLDQLLQAWKSLRPAGWSLWIVGDGAERAGLEETFAGLEGVSWLGWKEPDEVRQLVARASWLVLPSVWYEGFPMALLESLAEGTPAIVPNLGALPEIVGHGSRGHVYDGTVTGLSRALAEVANLPNEATQALRSQAIFSTEELYSPAQNLDRLMQVYEAAIDRVRLRSSKRVVKRSRTSIRAVARVSASDTYFERDLVSGEFTDACAGEART